ncbi:MAG: hydroxymethylbilane synthase [Deltaproteobacteria bacterium]|nr:hydroxymethylbilane synthase [Deltaproteobacteria bacterium]
MDRRVVIGTRGSQLAMWQANRVAAELRQAHPDLETVLQVVKTEGDQRPDVPFGSFEGRGVFVRELELALADGRVDLAVHSAKDVPTDLAPGLELVGALPRHDPRDALVGGSIDELPAGSRIGTSSPRRRAALARHRWDVTFVELRGNLETRLRKLDEGRFDATVLACAGLERLGLGHRIAERLAPDVCMPAPGQGIVVIEGRAGDERCRALLAAVTECSSLSCLAAERAVLEALGGGCQVPIGALATLDGRTLRLRAAVTQPDGKRQVDGETRGDVGAAPELGRALAATLIERGARELLGR